MYQVTEQYPADACGGGDFITGAARRDIVAVVDGAKVKRPELVIVCDKELDSATLYEGRVCLSETTVRWLGTLMGLYDGEAVEAVIADNQLLRAERERAEAHTLSLVQRIESMEATATVARIYVAADGSEHPSLAALRRHIDGEVEHDPKPLAVDVEGDPIAEALDVAEVMGRPVADDAEVDELEVEPEPIVVVRGDIVERTALIRHDAGSVTAIPVADDAAPEDGFYVTAVLATDRLAAEQLAMTAAALTEEILTADDCPVPANHTGALCDALSVWLAAEAVAITESLAR